MSLPTMIRRGKWSLRAGAIIVIGGLGWGCLSAAPLRLVGSDLLGPGFVSALKGFAKEKGIELEVDLAGSWRGRRDLEAERASVALISASPGDEALPARYAQEPLAYHVTFLWVPRALGLPQLSYDQIAEIFSNEAVGSRQRWRDFGAQGEGNSRLAVPRKGEAPAGLSWALLDYQLGRQINPCLDSNETGAETPDSLGGILIKASAPRLDDDWEAVAISRQPAGRAYQPTAVNVLRGDYPLNWPLRLVFRRTEVESLYPLLRFLLSDEVARELRSAGMMPLPESVRSERIFNFERL